MFFSAAFLRAMDRADGKPAQTEPEAGQAACNTGTKSGMGMVLARDLFLTCFGIALLLQARPQLVLTQCKVNAALAACLTTSLRHCMAACLRHCLACFTASLPDCLAASLHGCLFASLPRCFTASLPDCLAGCLPHLPHCFTASLPDCLIASLHG